MKKTALLSLAIIFFTVNSCKQVNKQVQKEVDNQVKHKAHNPIIFADVPDPSMIRVDDTYYMSSTTMHMNPGVPIMKSKDLIFSFFIFIC